MHRLFVATVVCVVALNSAAKAQARQDFELVNKTDHEILEVYLSPPKKAEFKEDILGIFTLEGDESEVINFKNPANTCKWDLKVVYAGDKTSAIWRDIDLCATSRISIWHNRTTGVTATTP